MAPANTFKIQLEAIEATGGTDKAGIKTTGGGTSGDGMQSYGAGKTVSAGGIENAESTGVVSVGDAVGTWSEGGDGANPSDSGGTGIVGVGGIGNSGGGGGAGIETEGGQGGASGAGGAGGLFGGGDAGGGDNLGGLGISTAGGSGEGTADGGIGGRFSGGSANGTGTEGLGLEAAPDVKIKMYSQNTEPTLLKDEAAAFWKDTDDSNKIYLIFRRGSADQVKIQLT